MATPPSSSSAPYKPFRKGFGHVPSQSAFAWSSQANEMGSFPPESSNFNGSPPGAASGEVEGEGISSPQMSNQAGYLSNFHSYDSRYDPSRRPSQQMSSGRQVHQGMMYPNTPIPMPMPMPQSMHPSMPMGMPMGMMGMPMGMQISMPIGMPHNRPSHMPRIIPPSYYPGLLSVPPQMQQQNIENMPVEHFQSCLNDLLMQQNLERQEQHAFPDFQAPQISGSNSLHHLNPKAQAFQPIQSPQENIQTPNLNQQSNIEPQTGLEARDMFLFEPENFGQPVVKLNQPSGYQALQQDLYTPHAPANVDVMEPDQFLEGSAIPMAMDEPHMTIEPPMVIEPSMASDELQIVIDDSAMTVDGPPIIGEFYMGIKSHDLGHVGRTSPSREVEQSIQAMEITEDGAPGPSQVIELLNNGSAASQNNNGNCQSSRKSKTFREQSVATPGPAPTNEGQKTKRKQTSKPRKQLVVVRPGDLMPKPTGPPDPNVKLRQLTDPPTERGYPGGKMKNVDIKEYLRNMMLIGRPLPGTNQRVTDEFTQWEKVPTFQGDVTDSKQIRSYLNTVTNWSNAFRQHVVKSQNALNAKVTKHEKETKETNEKLADVRKLLTELKVDPVVDPCDGVFLMHCEMNKLKGQMQKLERHHAECNDVSKEIGAHENLSEEDSYTVRMYRDHVKLLEIQLEISKAQFDRKIDEVRELETKLKIAKDGMVQQEIKVTSELNKSVFVSLQKYKGELSVDQLANKLKLTEEKLEKLTKKAKEWVIENDSFKRVSGWFNEAAEFSKERDSETAELSKERDNEALKTDITFKYLTLYENTKLVIEQNNELKVNLRETTDRMKKLETNMDKMVAKQVAEIDKLSRDKFEMARKVMAKLHESNDAYKFTMGTMESAISRAEVEHAAFKEKIKRLEAALKKATENVTAVELAEARLKTTQKEHSKAVHGMRKEYATVNKAYKELKEEREKSAEELNNLEKLRQENVSLAAEKLSMQGLCNDVWTANKKIVKDNEELNKNLFTVQLEVEALKRRLQVSGPARIYRQLKAENVPESGAEGEPDPVKGVTVEYEYTKNSVEECCLTMDEIKAVISEDGFRERIIFWLKKSGHI
ncbi:hypothetical protein TWF694_001641 [Orbilia ellipsospora]|uniref:Uncharacterized protein n=1 Tax=Orbilia ellipsospora TaxID=2528407 RepID=A0AAV9X4L2_9PEZI